MKFPLQLHDLGAQYGAGVAVYRVFDSTGMLVASNQAPLFLKLSTDDMRELVRRANAYDAVGAEYTAAPHQKADIERLAKHIAARHDLGYWMVLSNEERLAYQQCAFYLLFTLGIPWDKAVKP